MASPPAVAGKVTRRNLLTTAIGKKLIMAFTGISLVLFLIAHLAGNLLILQGSRSGRYTWFDTYADTLNAVPFLLFVELGLAAIVFIHAYDGYSIWKQNKAARGQEYEYKEWTKKEKSKKSKKSVASTTMMVTGIILLVFMVGHVWHFKYHNSIGSANPVSAHHAGEAAPAVGVVGATVAAPEEQSPEETRRDSLEMASHVVWELKKPGVAILYVLCMLAVTLHLYHAIGSSLQTLGAGASKIGQALWHLSRVVAVAVGLGFTLLPLYILFIAKPVPTGEVLGDAPQPPQRIEQAR